MLLREDDQGMLAIGQPAHAWLAGQLARAWGNAQFGAVEPYEDVCLAAEQHDIGWAERDRSPIYNPSNGRPLSFTEMPLKVHLALWTDGPRSLVSQSRYVALLVSLHGWRLYERKDLDRLSDDDAERIRRFLTGERAFQQELIGSLRQDAAAAERVRESQLERNSLLIWTWDYLSLALCLGWAPATAERAPTAAGPVDLVLTRDEPTGVHRLEPWPFATEELSVRCEGRRLPARCSSQEELQDAFAQAPWETLELRLARS